MLLSLITDKLTPPQASSDPNSQLSILNSQLPFSPLSKDDIYRAWSENYTHYDSLQTSYSLSNKQIDMVKNKSIITHEYVEMIQKGDLFIKSYKDWDEGNAEPEEMDVLAFDGDITYTYKPGDPKEGRNYGAIEKGMTDNSEKLINQIKMLIMSHEIYVKSETIAKDYGSNRIPELAYLLKYAAHVEVKPKTEKIDNYLCHVVEEEGMGYERKMWFAHEYGMLMVKSEYVKDKRKLRYVIEVKEIDSIDTNGHKVWYPKKIITKTSTPSNIYEREFITYDYKYNVPCTKDTFKVKFPTGIEVIDYSNMLN